MENVNEGFPAKKEGRAAVQIKIGNRFGGGGAGSDGAKYHTRTVATPPSARGRIVRPDSLSLAGWVHYSVSVTRTE